MREARVRSERHGLRNLRFFIVLKFKSDFENIGEEVQIPEEEL